VRYATLTTPISTVDPGLATTRQLPISPRTVFPQLLSKSTSKVPRIAADSEPGRHGNGSADLLPGSMVAAIEPPVSSAHSRPRLRGPVKKSTLQTDRPAGHAVNHPRAEHAVNHPRAEHAVADRRADPMLRSRSGGVRTGGLESLRPSKPVCKSLPRLREEVLK
jgi:hypothetical protein